MDRSTLFPVYYDVENMLSLIRKSAHEKKRIRSKYLCISYAKLLVDSIEIGNSKINIQYEIIKNAPLI